MKFSFILKKKYANWSELENIIENLPTTKQKGDVFEEFVYAYLIIKKQLYSIKELYMSKDIPVEYLEKYKIEKIDSGIDGLIIREDGLAAAYQVKFRTGRNTPSYDELAKFWVEAKNTDLNYVIANCYYLTGLAKKNDKHLQILVDEFSILDEEFFSELHSFTNTLSIKEKVRLKPHAFQEDIIKNVVEGFSKNDRGKLIAACGTGKTLTSLWIAERIAAQTVLFLAPSLALIKQTLEAWADQAVSQFSYLCVCSDMSVSDRIDEGDIVTSEFNIPVTTNPNDISKFIINNSEGKKYIFSTYQSLEAIADGIEPCKNFSFDLIIFDEAHRTAGTNKNSSFGFALQDGIIPSKKRLFMTATERLITPKLKKMATGEGRVVFSMDDNSVYGEVFHRYNFGQAIQDGVISNYEIIVAGIQEAEYYQWIKKNKDIETLINSSTEYSTAQVLFSQLIIAKAIDEFPIKKIISFHSSVKNASIFTGNIEGTTPLRQIIKEQNHIINDKNLYISHVNGTMNSGERKRILENFEKTEYSLVSNSRCLTEGVDVPAIDCVYFVDNKESLIDIVQACGRALRKGKNTSTKTAFFVIPILIPEDIEESEIVNLDAFDTVFNVIQSLRDQDDRLSEWIDELNINAVKGKSYSKRSWSPIKLTLPKTIDLSKFSDSLYLKVADVNKNPSSEKFKEARIYGKKERKSDTKRIFKTLGDYSFESYFKSLVIPTIRKFVSTDEIIDSKDLKINNNNVSHTKRLGLITKVKNGYSLTPLGIEYFNHNITDLVLFQKQMLRYFSSVEDNGCVKILFPYRACLKVLMRVQKISFHEFVFAIYTIEDSSNDSIIRAISDIYYLRANYSNLLLVNSNNRQHILDELNDYFGTKYTITEIWTHKTTIYNQFIYFKNHLALYERFITIGKDGEICFIKKNLLSARVRLAVDNKLEYDKDIESISNTYTTNFS